MESRQFHAMLFQGLTVWRRKSNSVHCEYTCYLYNNVNVVVSTLHSASILSPSSRGVRMTHTADSATERAKNETRTSRLSLLIILIQCFAFAEGKPDFLCSKCRLNFFRTRLQYGNLTTFILTSSENPQWCHAEVKSLFCFVNTKYNVRPSLRS